MDFTDSQRRPLSLVLRKGFPLVESHWQPTCQNIGRPVNEDASTLVSTSSLRSTALFGSPASKDPPWCFSSSIQDVDLCLLRVFDSAIGSPEGSPLTCSGSWGAGASTLLTMTIRTEPNCHLHSFPHVPTKSYPRFAIRLRSHVGLQQFIKLFQRVVVTTESPHDLRVVYVSSKPLGPSISCLDHPRSPLGTEYRLTP